MENSWVRQAFYGSVYAECLVDVNTDKVVEPRLCARDCRAGDGRLVHEAFYRIGVRDFLVVAKRKPLFPHGCITNVTAGRRVERSMMPFQVGQALLSKLVCAIGLRGFPGMSRDSKQRSCCNGGCEVHEIGSGCNA